MIKRIKTWFKDRELRKAEEVTRAKRMIFGIMFEGWGSDREYNVDRLPEWDYPYYPERPIRPTEEKTIEAIKEKKR